MRPLYGNITKVQQDKEMQALLGHQKTEIDRLTALVLVRDQELYDSIEDTYKANIEIAVLKAAAI